MVTTVAQLIAHLQTFPQGMEVFDADFSGTQPVKLDDVKIIRVIRRSVGLWEPIYPVPEQPSLSNAEMCVTYRTSLDKISTVVILG